jgi:D-3-phosphoglycerate dehydrogenase / 2-oxoglutarate reductase
MPKWKILLTDGLDQVGQELLRSAAHVIDQENISPSELIQVIGDYDALVVRGRTKVTRHVFEAAASLKVVGRAGVGVDNIDLHAAAERQVIVVNAPVSSTQAVAELALALMFSLARALPTADAGMKRGHWLKKHLEGVELTGKTLGIIGLGNIGRSLAQKASVLGMTVLGIDPFLTEGEIAKRGARPVSMDELYAHADFISLHVPLTTETHHLINATAFQQMKPGIRLVSTARGGVIDEAALLAALEEGKVSGAALDVYSHEPPGLTPLVSHPNVIATPHIGAQTVEAQARAALDIASEVLAVLHGEAPRWRVV